MKKKYDIVIKRMEDAISTIRSNGGKFIGVSYRNKEGVVKDYVVRMGVKKYLTGGTKVEVPNSVTVYSLYPSVGYRTFKAEGILKIKRKGVIYSK